MQLMDKDLLSVQEVRALVSASKKAQQKLAEMTAEQIDRIIRQIAEAGVRNAERLARMANEDTGFGVVADKTIKNIFASQGVYDAVKDLKTIGEIERDDVQKVKTIAVPVGVIAGIIPSTNPTSTTLYKAIVAIKAGNSIVFSPHPAALRCILETVKVIRQAIAETGGDEDLVTCITIPTMQAIDCLMTHRDTALIMATGGSAMVRSAYSSGTPAIGVGPGNSPAFIERTADIPMAVRRIMDSKTFDNGTICASEQSIICEEDMRAVIQAEMEKQGAYFLNAEESKRLGAFILRANGTMNPEIVGRDVQTIAKLAGLSIPADRRVLVAEESGVGRGHPYSNEKLCPILAFYTGKNYEEICDTCCVILHYEGVGHTFSIHTQDEKIVDYFAKRIPVSRMCVNTASALGGVGATTGLFPSFTLGCGAMGGSATSDNVGPLNLINVKKVAYGLRELSEIKGELPTCEDGLCSINQSFGDIPIDAIVKEVLERLKAI